MDQPKKIMKLMVGCLVFEDDFYYRNNVKFQLFILLILVIKIALWKIIKII